MGVYLRRRDDIYGAPGRSQYLPDRAQASFLLRRRNIVEGERSQHEIEAARRKLAQVSIFEQHVLATRVNLSRVSNHGLGNVDSRHAEAVGAQKPRGAACSAPEIQGAPPDHMAT